MTQIDPIFKQEGRDHRLDTIKAISICFVVIWHVNPLKSENVLIKGALSLLLDNMSLIGVPSFLTVSFLLFGRKILDRGPRYFRNRAIRLLQIFLFWFFVQYLLAFLLKGQMAEFSVNLILAGGPGLPRVGGSVFYFLSHLIILTFALYGFLFLPARTKKYLSAAVLCLTFLFFFTSSTTGFELPYQYLLSFIVYIPLSYYLLTDMDFFMRHRKVFVVLFFLALFYERIMRLLYHIPYAPYSRLSIFFGVILMFIVAYGNVIRPSRHIVVLSKYSLGIFAVHKYFQLLSLTVFEILIGKNHEGLWYASQYPLVLLATIIFTAIFIFLMRNTFLRPYLS